MKRLVVWVAVLVPLSFFVAGCGGVGGSSSKPSTPTTPEQKKQSFLHVVAVEYPRKGLWSLGFVTGTGLREIAGQARRELLTVLVPKSPALVSGYVITVPKEDAIFLDMTVEEAFRFLVSAGVILPESERGLPRPAPCAVAAGQPN